MCIASIAFDSFGSVIDESQSGARRGGEAERLLGACGGSRSRSAKCAVRSNASSVTSANGANVALPAGPTPQWDEAVELIGRNVTAVSRQTPVRIHDGSLCDYAYSYKVKGM